MENMAGVMPPRWFKPTAYRESIEQKSWATVGGFSVQYRSREASNLETTTGADVLDANIRGHSDPRGHGIAGPPSAALLHLFQIKQGLTTPGRDTPKLENGA
jgi:hypothetical protein